MGYTAVTDTTDSFDTLTNERVMVDHVHEELHVGNRFQAVEVTSIAGTTNKYYTLLTGAKEVHFIANVTSDALLTLRVLEGSTVTVNGSGMTFLNKRRSLATTPLCTAFSGSTVTVDGTLLAAFVLGTTGGTPGNGSSVSTRGDQELVFKANTTYTVKLTTGSGTANPAVAFDIYEL